MSAAAIPYWESPASWGTATTATIDVARPEDELDETREEGARRVRGPHERQQVVFVVAPHHASVYSEAWEQVRYGIRGVCHAPRMFLVEAPVSVTSLASVAETFTAEEADRSLWRWVFPISGSRKILFSETLELHTAKLRRLKPRVSLDRRTLERENA